MLCGEWFQDIRKEAMRRVRPLSWFPRKEIGVGFMDMDK